ncbi:unnamed protein product [Ambrosiozyma monospora]|uniref:Unnamed protein product n=1 Tax=Ambrosiozyma monospora TaxID=43982 RepID=A0ACB5SX58_AMBMO|nr:unnamed protein product [Ambrosiozyma monospora]
MFWEILVAEWLEKQTLYDLLKEIVSACYDVFFSSTTYMPGATEVQNFASVVLNIHNILDVEDESYHPFLEVSDTMFEFAKTAVEMMHIPHGEEFDDARTYYKINISGYLMKVDKPELLQSLVNEMYESNLKKNNFVQAALSLDLLADTYQWDTSYFLPKCKAPEFPAQSEFKRKEALYKLIAANYVKGGKIEQAIDTYNDLLEAYKKYNFDLSGLGFCHGQLCKSYNAMESTGRLDSSYFKVSFIGLGFPTSVRGKEYIYEGMHFEHITSMNHRLTRLYPGSRLISNEDEAKKLAADPPFGKYIYTKTVTPAKSFAGNNHLTYMTRQYIDNKNLNVFVSHRRLPGSTNITNLWTEEVTYETELTFPTLMNRSEIKMSNSIRISPIKNAIKSLLEKNSELKGLEFWINRNLQEGIDPKSLSGTTMFGNLSRVLAGTVDSPVNGGVGQYRTFFTAVSHEPDYKENVVILKNSFADLIELLDNLLKLHQALLPAVLAPQHRVMVDLFCKNFESEIEQLELDVNATLDLQDYVDNLITSNMRSHRETTRHVDPELASLMGESTTSGSTRGDDVFSVNGSAGGTSIHSGSRPPSTLGSYSRYGPGGKRTLLNYK